MSERLKASDPPKVMDPCGPPTDRRRLSSKRRRQWEQAEIERHADDEHDSDLRFYLFCEDEDAVWRAFREP